MIPNKINMYWLNSAVEQPFFSLVKVLMVAAGELYHVIIIFRCLCVYTFGNVFYTFFVIYKGFIFSY